MSNKDIMEYDFDEAEQEYAEGNTPEINRPYNPDMVDIITQPITIHGILDRIENNEIDLTPAFQRKDGLWNQTQKSRLIESILIKIPLPVFYFDSRDDDNWIIVDGLQRISTLNDFVLKKNFRLSNLEYLTQYKNLSYDELPPKCHRLNRTR